ncbi:GntR family transcriptional regulator [Victivallis sp. Marseille-Q1083]|uniref:GntR family transcriptional regulator n=1 Tax=Victivallis sp. Marseille-Q1083 TaxID=2717288 RepID=UPI00158C740A|nr:GntR family transcriptional regulator [Victivallis sp. Marseille-Q1083]
MYALEKDISTPVARQLYDVLVQRMTSGHYPPGGKLDSVRSLRHEFKVSNTVVMQTLDLLEKDQLIVRLPAKGIFVSRKHAVPTKLLRVILVFPEPAISPEVLSLSDWYTDADIYRGMLDTGFLNNTSIHLEYFPETSDSLELSSQLQRLAGYDAAVFYGDQCRELRMLARSEVPVIAVIQWGRPAKNYGNELKVGFSDAETIQCLVDCLKQQDYRRCGCIIVPGVEDDIAFFGWRAAEYRRLGWEAGLPLSAAAFLELSLNASDAEERIMTFLQREKPDFIFFNGDKLELLYNALARLCMQPGKDLDFMYIGTTPICPMCSHVEPPFVDIGRRIITEIVKCCRDHRPVPVRRIMLHSRVVTGISTRFSK